MSHAQGWNRWWSEHARTYSRAEEQANGVEYARQLLQELHSLVPNFRPNSFLDFGCGVGRVLLPLCQAWPEARGIGVDISDGAIGETRTLLAERGITTASFINPTTAEIPAGFDFLHSFTVFQHIPIRQGLQRFAELVGKLTPAGVGAVHFTYAPPRSVRSRAIYLARRWIPGAHVIANHLSSQPPMPFTLMSPYPMDEVLSILQEQGCHRISARFSDHGWLGVRLMFQKASLPSL